MINPLALLKLQPQIDSAGAEGPLLQLGQLTTQLAALCLLVAAVMLSALAVIYTAYDYRRLFNQQQILLRQSDQYQIEWGQLLLEQSAWGANNRVEQLAAERLQMEIPEPSSIRLAIYE